MNIGLLNLASKWLSFFVISFTSLFNGNAYIEKEVDIVNKNATKDVKIVSVVTPYKTETKYNSKIPKNVTNVLVEGKDEVKYQVENGEELVIQEKVNKVIEKGTGAVGNYTGRLSGYGPDCTGCSGTGGLACKTKSGTKHNLVQDGIYYNDSEYGQVRILAAALKAFPCGTIIEITKTGKDPFFGVVMDTGATMSNKWNDGIVWIDLAYSTEKDKSVFAADDLTGSNINFKVKRWGW